MKTRAKWSRWGWGACEGCSLEIGETFRCSVVLKPGNGSGEPPSYTASINSHMLGRHADREAAMRAVEKELESRMAGVQHDWMIYQALKALNDDEVPRLCFQTRRRR
jgi:hypothetical protein